MDWQGLMDAGGTDAIGGFLTRHYKTRAQNRIRAAQNRNAQITGARNAGIISQNRARVREEATSARVKLQRARNKAKAAVGVSAAFAGVRGGSVDATSFEIARSAAERSNTLQGRATAEMAQLQEQEYQNRVNTALAQQTMLSGPNILDLALGLTGAEFQRRADDTGSDGLGQPETDTSRSGINLGTIFNLTE